MRGADFARLLIRATKRFSVALRRDRALRPTPAIQGPLQVVFPGGVYYCFRQWRGLDVKEPPEVPGGEVLVSLAIHLVGWRDVQHGPTGDNLRMVQHHAMQDASAAVMRHHLNLVKPSACMTSTWSLPIARLE